MKYYSESKNQYVEISEMNPEHAKNAFLKTLADYVRDCRTQAYLMPPPFDLRDNTVIGQLYLRANQELVSFRGIAVNVATATDEMLSDILSDALAELNNEIIMRITKELQHRYGES